MVSSKTNFRVNSTAKAHDDDKTKERKLAEPLKRANYLSAYKNSPVNNKNRGDVNLILCT